MAAGSEIVTKAPVVWGGERSSSTDVVHVEDDRERGPRWLEPMNAMATTLSADASLLPEMLAALHHRPFGSDTEWRRCLQLLASVHPDVRVRIELARTAPVGVVLHLTQDHDVRVRFSILSNPAVVDHRVQRTLADDPDPRVVVGLLNRISPSRETSLAVIAGPHVEARRVLAGMRLHRDVYCALSEDDDLVTRMIAGRALRSLPTGAAHRPASPALPMVQDADEIEEPRRMTDFQARLYRERAGLTREEAEPWWKAGVRSALVAGAIEAGRSPEEEAERQAQAERDWLARKALMAEGHAIEVPGLEPLDESEDPPMALAS